MTAHSHDRDGSTTGSQIASALAGAVAGVAVGLLLAQTLGGVSGIRSRLRGRRDGAPLADPGDDWFDEEPDDELLDEPGDFDTDEELGERVLEAFSNDPTLAERAIDIDVGPDATVELTGWVDDEREIDYAATVAGGVPGVRQVVTELAVQGKGRRRH
ncbi:MAG TPA: BON domain-containing protein [Gemmatimonadaceae bacterium]|nr:BON domain-containing protein [Gemmatimonadaceae bacterium]